MLEWERYDEETWGLEWLTRDGRDLYGLIKCVRDDHYSIVVGTYTELEWSGEAETLTDSKARVARFIMLYNNCEPHWVNKVKWKV